MKTLKKKVERESNGRVFERGKWRSVVITLEPPCLLKFRAKGCRRSYSLTSSDCYVMAVKADVADKKKKAKKAH